MVNRVARSAVYLGISSCCLLTNAAVTYAQSVNLPVTGGSGSLVNSRIFVPVPGSADPRTVVFEGSVPDNLIIRTNIGNVRLNAIFRGSTLPILSTPAGGVPGVGDTGNVLGTLSFRAFSAAGEPALFTNLPTELNFQLNSINFANTGCGCTPTGQLYTEYQTAPTVLSETGTAETATSFSSTRRDTPVVLVQYQPGSSPPQAQRGVSGNAFLYTVIPGLSYSADFAVNLTGGSITIPDPPGFSATGNTSNSVGGNSSTNVSTNTGTSTAIFIPRFNSGQPNSVGTVGFSQNVPVLPTVFVPSVFTFINVRSGNWFDPPLTSGYEYEMKASPEAIGLASRVYPGLSGSDLIEGTLFTAITGFPKEVDADDRFTVSVDGKVLGEFGPGDKVSFRDYQQVLGDSLVKGQGVKKFTVTNINPRVDSADPRAFPLRIEFSRPTASFEMRAMDEGVAQKPNGSAGDTKTTAMTPTAE